MKVKTVSTIRRFLTMLSVTSIYLCTGLEYQEDLKIRAMNDVTARKDKEHLEVRSIEWMRQNNIQRIPLGNDQTARSDVLVSVTLSLSLFLSLLVCSSSIFSVLVVEWSFKNCPVVIGCSVRSVKWRFV